MLKFILGLLMLVTVTLLKAQPIIGSQAPEIILKNVDGTPISLSSLKGKVVIIDFWATWCPPCRIANKTLVKLYQSYKDKGLEIYSISEDRTINAWKRGIKADNMTWLNVYDDQMKVATKWKVGYLPFTFIVDKTGKLVNADFDVKELENEIKKLL